MRNATGSSSEDRTAEGAVLHKPEDFEGMRRAGKLAAEALDMIAEHVKPGVTTGRLDAIIEQFVNDNGATSATIGYRGYKHASCISINHVVCHGIPGPKVLRAGDILNIDVTVIVDGWFGDTSRMFVAGKPNRRAERLINVTHQALMEAIAVVRPGALLRDVAAAVQAVADQNRCSVVYDFCGHGLGRVFHAPPSVVHALAREPKAGERDFERKMKNFKEQSTELRPGMFFTIEPMINLGRAETKILPDGWTAVTRDRSLSAQFEHSIGVTEEGCEIFTLSPAGRYHPTWEQ